jgi:hypothetical protein
MLRPCLLVLTIYSRKHLPHLRQHGRGVENQSASLQYFSKSCKKNKSSTTATAYSGRSAGKQ